MLKVFSLTRIAESFMFHADELAPAAAPVDPVAATAQAAAASDEAPATVAVDVPAQAAAASDEAPATVAVDVPAQHVALLDRVVALLKRDEQWIVDNVEAGIAHFETMLGIDTPTTGD